MWEAMPPVAKAVLGTGLRFVPVGFLLGRSFRQWCRFLQEAERWPREKRDAHLVVQLRRICTLAYEATDYYRASFDAVGLHPQDVKTVDDLGGLPLIDKHTLRTHMRTMCTRSPDASDVDLVTTGGSSGEPLGFYIGRDRSETEYAHLMTSWRRIGYAPGIPLAVLRGQVVPEDRSGLRHRYDPALRHHYYSAFHLNEKSIRRYIEHMRHIGPCFLHVYPSSVAAVARCILGGNIRPPANIRGVIAESEIAYREQREMVTRALGVPYFACYGHSEKLVLAAECEHTTDYHVWPTYGFCELIDDEQRRITTPGQRGEIVGTGFINTVVPFIRYRTGDYGTYVGERCESCGREQLIIRDVRGHRTQEVLVAADGTEISWTSLNMHDDTFINVQRFQFYQDAPGRAVLRIVPTAAFADADANRITRNLSHKLEERLKISIVTTEHIPLSPRGKAIYVDQRIASTNDTAHSPGCS